MTRRLCGNSIARVMAFAFLTTLNSQHSLAQTSEGAPASEVLQWTEAKQVEFVKSVMETGFPERDGDQFGILLINRSALVIPMLEGRVEQELGEPSPSERFIDMASAMIAYAGDFQSLLTIGKLVQIDEARFGRLVGRTLDNALAFRNPFNVAYRGVEIGNQSVSAKIATWAATALQSRRMQRLLAEAMVERYGRVPSESEWAGDPLVVLVAASPELRGSVLDLTRQHFEKKRAQ